MSSKVLKNQIHVSCLMKTDLFKTRYHKNWIFVLEEIIQILNFTKIIRHSENKINFIENFKIFTENNDFGLKLMKYILSLKKRNENMINVKFKIKNLFLLFENYKTKNEINPTKLQVVCLIKKYPFLQIIKDFDQNFKFLYESETKLISNEENDFDTLQIIYLELTEYFILNLNNSQIKIDFLSMLITQNEIANSKNYDLSFIWKAFQSSQKLFRKEILILLKVINKFLREDQRSKFLKGYNFLFLSEIYFQNNDLNSNSSDLELELLEKLFRISTKGEHNQKLIKETLIRRVNYLNDNVQRLSKKSEIVNLRIILSIYLVLLNKSRDEQFVIKFLTIFQKLYETKKNFDMNLSTDVYMVIYFNFPMLY